MREIIAPLSQLLKSGEISSVELTNKYINAIENDNPKYNAYVSTTFEKALENAKFADKLIAIDPERGTQLANNLECSLMAIPLVAHEALTTAYINDVDGLGVFAQQLFGFGKEGDVFLGISTSGNSKNVLPATVVARALGIKVIGLTGAKGGELAEVADVAVKAPETETYMVQELHLPIYHCWCLMLEDKFFGQE